MAFPPRHPLVSAPATTLYPKPPPTNHPLMVSAPHPSRIITDHLLPASILVHARHPILTTLPRPAPIPVLLHSFPLERRARLDLDIAARPDRLARRILVGVQRHRAREVPVAQLGDGADDVDTVAPLGANLDRKGERDGFGEFAGGRSVGDGDGEGCGGFAVAGGVDVVGVHEGVDGAVVGEAGGGVGDVVGVCGGDCLGVGAVAGGVC